MPVLPDLRLGPDLGVDGNQIGLPRDLDAISAEIEQGHHAGADLADEGIDRALHIFRPTFSLRSTSNSVRRNSSASVRASRIVVESGVLASG